MGEKKSRHGPNWTVVVVVTALSILLFGCGGGVNQPNIQSQQENISAGSPGQNPFLMPLSGPTGIDTGHNDPAGLLDGVHVPTAFKGFTAATAIESATVENGELKIVYTREYLSAVQRIASDRSVSAINQLDFQFDAGTGSDQEFTAGHGEIWHYQVANLTGFDSERPIAVGVHPTIVTSKEYYLVLQDWVMGRYVAFGPFSGNANLSINTAEIISRWVTISSDDNPPELRLYFVAEGGAGSLPAEGTVDYVNAFSLDYHNTLPPLQLAESKKLYVLVGGERQSSSLQASSISRSADTPFGVPLFNKGRVTSGIKSGLSRFEGMTFRFDRTASASANMEGDDAGEVEMNWEFPNENDPVWGSLAFTSVPERIQGAESLIVGQADPPTESFIDTSSNPTGDVVKPLPGDASYDLTELSLAGPGQTQDMGSVVVPVLTPKNLEGVYDTATTTSSLSWSPVYGASGYKIWRNLDGAGYQLIATLGNVQTYDDVVGSGHFNAQYKAQALSGGMTSADSDPPVSVITVSIPQADDWATDSQVVAANGLNGCLQYIDSTTGVKTVIVSDYDGVTCKQYQQVDGLWTLITNGESTVTGWMDALGKHLVFDNGCFYLIGINANTGVHLLKSSGAAPLTWSDTVATSSVPIASEADVAVLAGNPAVVFATSGNDVMFATADTGGSWSSPHQVYDGAGITALSFLNLVEGTSDRPIAVWYAADGPDSGILSAIASDSTPTQTADWNSSTAVASKMASAMSVTSSSTGSAHITFITGGQQMLWYSSSTANAGSWNAPLLVKQVSGQVIGTCGIGLISGNKAYVSYVLDAQTIGLAVSGVDYSQSVTDWVFGSAGSTSGPLAPSVVLSGSHKGVVYYNASGPALYQR